MLIQVLTYYFFISMEYIAHQIGHYKHKYNPIYNLHMIHHKKYYPVNSLTSKKYKSKNEGIIAYTPPSILICIILYKLLSFQVFVCVATQILFHATFNDMIHTQIHIEGSVLERFHWFRECRRIHFIHHKHLSKNYSFGIDNSIDKLNNSFSDNKIN
jgi:sterol desaturase/sphingolipid hydroxylase (fatty acid hydroxylase superfamily)